jgi:D-beta-D-heptose 7-phosphate kinase/D-beta-D-heptose 1-phosphate adenosyltransferase
MVEIYSDLLLKFPHSRVLVIGDLMLDESLWGHIQRISPEAPVPIFNLVRRGYALGGAGNVVRNLKTLGARVIVLGAVGEDSTGRQIVTLLDELGVDGQGVLCDRTRRSSRKTRLMSLEHGQQVFRMDDESAHPIDQLREDALLARLESILPDTDAILCSDYLKGVLTEGVLQETFRLANRRNLQVTVAPKDANRNKYRGAGVLVPNAVELARLAGASIDETGWLPCAATKLFNEMAIQALLVTRGREGMSLFERPNGEVLQVDIPTTARSVYDVTGAGDTAVSVFTLTVAAGADRETAARLANVAAGIVVGKRGTASVTVQEIQQRLLEFQGLAPESGVKTPAGAKMGASAGFARVQARSARRTQIGGREREGTGIEFEGDAATES